MRSRPRRTVPRVCALGHGRRGPSDEFLPSRPWASRESCWDSITDRQSSPLPPALPPVLLPALSVDVAAPLAAAQHGPGPVRPDRGDATAVPARPLGVAVLKRRRQRASLPGHGAALQTGTGCRYAHTDDEYDTVFCVKIEKLVSIVRLLGMILL